MSGFTHIQATPFDLAATLNCGQVFHWSPSGNGFLGLIGSNPAYIEQCGPELLVRGASRLVVQRYFSLDRSLEEIRATFPEDAAMQAAADFCAGIRIIRQPLWECLATFLTSAMKQVAHIRQMSLAIRERWGDPVDFQGTRLYAYPSPERLAFASEADLRACKLGFRAPNLLGAARMIANREVDLELLLSSDDETALRELCRLPGVGEKIANCALLFAYERQTAFPIDVWIERVLTTLYFPRRRKVKPAELREFSRTYFGEWSGWAQQYLFHHARMTWKETHRKPAAK